MHPSPNKRRLRRGSGNVCPEGTGNVGCHALRARQLGSELRKISKSDIVVFLRIAIVTLEPESKVRNMRTATRGNGWRPRGGSSLAERRVRPGSDGLTLPAGAQRRKNLRWSETTRMAPKASCHDPEPRRERPRAPRPRGSDPDVRTNTQTRWLMSADTVRTCYFVWETP